MLRLTNLANWWLLNCPLLHRNHHLRHNGLQVSEYFCVSKSLEKLQETKLRSRNTFCCCDRFIMVCIFSWIIRITRLLYRTHLWHIYATDLWSFPSPALWAFLCWTLRCKVNLFGKQRRTWNTWKIWCIKCIDSTKNSRSIFCISDPIGKKFHIQTSKW